MPASSKPVCPQRSAVEALSHDRLPAELRPAAQRHLETCATCRTLFRRTTSGWLPHVRNYTILEQVGRGGFGAVFKAVHHQKQRIEALKIHSGRTKLRAAYFENEVRLIARLRHPSIATLYEANLAGDPPYYAMEFVEGVHLDDYLRSKPITLEQRIRIVQAVVRAIGYAHEHSVIHRDIKPQNILIDAAGLPRLVDFGIGKLLGLAEPFELHAADAREMPEGPIGTFGYIAPEQMAGGRPTERSDIFALGALLFHCLTGAPARRATRIDQLAGVLRRRSISRAEDLAAIIARCVAEDPAARYASCAALDRDLENYLAAWQVEARRSRPFGYSLLRGLGYTLRHNPAALRGPLLLAAALLLSAFWHARDLRYFAPAGAPDSSRLVAITDQTIAALASGALPAPAGFSAADQLSLRSVYAELLRRLATARPRAVAMDYFFRRPAPDHDAQFVAAIRALGAPLIIGARDFGIDGEPLETLPEIAAAAHAIAHLVGDRPRSGRGEFRLPLAVQRGGAPPFAGLAATTYAAWRFPDSRAHFAILGSDLRISYERRAPQPAQPRWRPEVDLIPILAADRLAAGLTAAVLQRDDRVYNAAFRFPAPDFWEQQMIPAERVLAASDTQLRDWFGDRAIVIGQARGDTDRYAIAPGQEIFGCQAQALALHGLLTRALPVQLSRVEILLRALGWCAAGLLLAVAVRRYLARLTPRAAALGAGGLLAAGVLLVLLAAGRSMLRVEMEFTVALAALFTTAAMALPIEWVRERQLSLATSAVWNSEDSTLSHTQMLDASASPVVRTRATTEVHPAAPPPEPDPAAQPAADCLPRLTD